MLICNINDDSLEQGISDTPGLDGDLLVMDANSDLKLDLFGSTNGQR